MANLLTLLICTFFAFGFLIVTISAYMYYANNTNTTTCNIDNYSHNSTNKIIPEYKPELIKSAKKYQRGYKNNLLTDAEKNQRKFYPKFTKYGYKLTKLSDTTYNEILNFFKTHKDQRTHETQNWVITDSVNNKGEPNLFLTNIHKDGQLVNKINNEIKNILTDWLIEENAIKWDKLKEINDYSDNGKQHDNNWVSKYNVDTLPLTHTSTYGIRTYCTGNELSMHLDKGGTHIISAIIFIDKSDENDENGKPINWPLDVQGFEDEDLKPIFMDSENNLLLYESATVLHGRTTSCPLKNYSNMYVHFKPNGW